MIHFDTRREPGSKMETFARMETKNKKVNTCVKSSFHLAASFAMFVSSSSSFSILKPPSTWNGSHFCPQKVLGSMEYLTMREKSQLTMSSSAEVFFAFGLYVRIPHWKEIKVEDTSYPCTLRCSRSLTPREKELIASFTSSYRGLLLLSDIRLLESIGKFTQYLQDYPVSPWNNCRPTELDKYTKIRLTPYWKALICLDMAGDIDFRSTLLSYRTSRNLSHLDRMDPGAQLQLLNMSFFFFTRSRTNKGFFRKENNLNSLFSAGCSDANCIPYK